MAEEADLDALVTSGLATVPITKAELVAFLISWAARVGSEDTANESTLASHGTRISALEAGLTQNFAPSAFGSTVAISATTTSSSQAVSTSDTEVMIYNTGTVPVFARWGTGTVTAIAPTDLPIPPGSVEIFHKGSAGVVAVITNGGAATAYLTTGVGS